MFGKAPQYETKVPPKVFPFELRPKLLEAVGILLLFPL